jgi:hypothetical protein
MEIKDWYISSTIEIKDEIYEINAKFDFQNVKSSGIIYRRNGDWEDIVYSKAMKKFRMQFKDSIKRERRRCQNFLCMGTDLIS